MKMTDYTEEELGLIKDLVSIGSLIVKVMTDDFAKHDLKWVDSLNLDPQLVRLVKQDPSRYGSTYAAGIGAAIICNLRQKSGMVTDADGNDTVDKA